MMRIVVLDGYTLNPGDLSWQGLEALGDCRVYDRTSPAEVVGRALDAEIVLTNKVKLTEEIMAELPRLRYIGVLATGYNVVGGRLGRLSGFLLFRPTAFRACRQDYGNRGAGTYRYGGRPAGTRFWHACHRHDLEGGSAG